MAGKILNITGKKFGTLTAIKPTEKRKRKYTVWSCQCECGNKTEASTADLRKGDKKSCGCLVVCGEDISGKKFGRLTAIKPTEKRKWKSVLWLCQCECGNKKEVTRKQLVSRIRKSCGCINKAKHNYPPESYELKKGQRASKYMSDWYIRELIKDHLRRLFPGNVLKGEISQEMIELKRSQLKLRREILKAKEIQNEFY